MEKRNSYLVNRAFKGFLLASVLTVAVNQVGGMVDGMMLSYFINEQAMSSVNICRPVMQALFALSMLIGAGSSMMTGVAIGNHQRHEANRIFTAVMMMVVAVGVAALVAGVAFLDPLARWLCSDEALRGVSAQYLGVTLYGALFYMATMVLNMFVAVDGNPKRVTLAVTVSMLTNLVLDYIFIKLLGWGVLGAAWATVASYVVAVAVLLPHFLHADTLRLQMRSCTRLIGSILSSGLPFGLATMLIAVQLWGNNTLVMHYLGEGGIIALSVCCYLLLLSMIILTGTLKAFQPVASILKGAGDVRGVMMVIGRAYRFMAICFVVFVIPLVFFPRVVAQAFGVSDGLWQDITAGAIPPFTLNIVLQCAIYLLIPIYQLFGNKRLSLFVSVGQSLAPMFGLWLFAEVVPGYIWWGFAAGQLAILLGVLVLAAIVRSRHTELSPILLVPDGKHVESLETSMPRQMEAVGTMLQELDGYLKKHVVDSRLTMHIEVCSEELLKNAIQHGGGDGKRRFIDYRLTLHDKQAVVVISDDGKAFNPVEYDNDTGLGLLLVRGLCQNVKYDYLFQQNMTTITFEKSE